MKIRVPKSRGLTGAIFSITVALCLCLSFESTVVIISALSALCAYEFYFMLRSDAKLPNELVGIVAAALYPISYAIAEFTGLLLLSSALTIIVLVWYVFYPRARIGDVAITIFGAMYTGLMLTSIVGIRTIIPGLWGGVLTFGIVLAIWANDTMAFAFGSRLGRHKLAPRISPGKSIEGFIAGIAGSVFIWLAFPLIPGCEISIPVAILGAVITGIFGILGDLVESRIKRSTGHKDSSNLLPGHGGFLDRCDAMILGGSATMLFFKLIGLG